MYMYIYYIIYIYITSFLNTTTCIIIGKIVVKIVAHTKIAQKNAKNKKSHYLII